MAASTEFADFIVEQLSALGRVNHRRFFSGRGIVADGVQFGMILRGELYFVVDDTSRPKYAALGSHCFGFMRGGKRVESHRWYSVPVQMLEDDDALSMLAREAILAASLAQAAKRKKKPRAKRKTVVGSKAKAVATKSKTTVRAPAKVSRRAASKPRGVRRR